MSPLQLENYYIIESHYASKIDGFPDGFESLRSITLSQNAVEAKAELRTHKDDALRYLCVLTITPKEQLLCSFKVVMMGMFAVDADWVKIPKNDPSKLVLITGASILYSSAREHLLTISGRGVHPAILLPTVQFGVTPVPTVASKEQPAPTV